MSPPAPPARVSGQGAGTIIVPAAAGGRMRLLVPLLALAILLPTTIAAPPGSYQGEGRACTQNALVTGIPGLVTNCRVSFVGSVAVLSCEAAGCRYQTTGNATVRTDADAYLEVSTDVTTEVDGAFWTCRSASPGLAREQSCAGSVSSFATVAPGGCVKLWATANGYVGLAASRETAPGAFSTQAVAVSSQFAKICRDALGAPSVVAP